MTRAPHRRDENRSSWAANPLVLAVAALASGTPPLGACDGDSAGSGNGPKLESVSPTTISARGGEVLTIAGSGFREGAAVRLGSQALTVLAVTDATLTARTTVQLAGAYDLTVEAPDGDGGDGGDSATLERAVTVEPLSLAFREAAAHYLPDFGDADIRDAAASDVDGDGDPDLLLAVSGGQGLLLINSGEGAFSEAPVDPEVGPGLSPWVQDTRAMVLADLDGDGDPDLFGCSGSGEPNRLFYNDGTGRFREVDALPPRVGSCLLAEGVDLDGDTLPELIVLATREGIDATHMLRVYRNESTPTDLRFSIASELEPSLAPTGEIVGGVWTGSDPSHAASLTRSGDNPSAGAGCGAASYDFAGVDGYVLFFLPTPPIEFVPDELHLQVRGDGSGHRLSVRVRDGAGERFTREIGPLDDASWEAVTGVDIATWEHFAGNDDGVVDLPLDRVTVQVDRVAGGPEQGTLYLDEVELWNVIRGTAPVERFERAVPAHGWTADRFANLAGADLDGDVDTAIDLALFAHTSPGGDYVRTLRNATIPTAEGGTLLRFTEQTAPSPDAAMAFGALLDLEADRDPDLLLLTAGQDRVLINDGNARFFDDTVSLLPVDRVDGRHAAVGDLDLDGLPDVVIANHGEANRLYLGSAEGRLLDHTPALGMTRDPSWRVLVLDADGDGILDVLVLNDEAPRMQLFLSVAPGGE